MDYAKLKKQAANGDVLMVENRGIIGRAIRMLTGQQVSHIAMLFKAGTGLFVAEMKEFKGYQMMAASQWFTENNGYIYYGTAPAQVQRRPKIAKAAIFSMRGKSYNYLSLVGVWFAQLFRRKTTDGLVCSTAVQRVWETCGYEFEQTPDPGDFMRLCGSVSRVTPPDETPDFLINPLD